MKEVSRVQAFIFKTFWNVIGQELDPAAPLLQTHGLTLNDVTSTTWLQPLPQYLSIVWQSGRNWWRVSTETFILRKHVSHSVLPDNSVQRWAGHHITSGTKRDLWEPPEKDSSHRFHSASLWLKVTWLRFPRSSYTVSIFIIYLESLLVWRNSLQINSGGGVPQGPVLGPPFFCFHYFQIWLFLC